MKPLTLSKSKQQNLAVILQSLYLANLLLLPLFSFIAMIFYFNKYKDCKGYFRIHLYRAIQLSVLAGVFLALVPLLIVLFSNAFDTSLMVMLVYFVTMHAIFVLLGMFNISRAMANKLPLF